MKYSNTILALCAAAGVTTAAPLLAERQEITTPVTDEVILNYALTLEHLENTFYRQGLQNFTQEQFAEAGFDGDFYNNLKIVAEDEQIHVDFLTKAITAEGLTPVKECTYKFPVTDPKTFVVVSSVLEGVGVSAYLGAAAKILEKKYLTAAGSILTVEARHSSYIRTELNQTGFPSPFDVPLSLRSVFTLAADFIASCPPENPTLPLKPFPKLTLAPSAPSPVVAGSKITLLTPGTALKPADGTSPIFGAFITVTGPIIVAATPVHGGFDVEVPKGVNGQSYVVLTGCNGTVTDDNVAAGPAIVEITNPLPMSK